MDSSSPPKDGSVAQEAESTSASHSLVQQAGDDLFGASQSSGSLFGPVAPQANGLFGNEASHSSVGSLFGDAPQSSGSVFNASPSPYQGSGLFGSSPLHTNAIGSLCGTSPHTTSNLFDAALQAGGTSSVGSLFGAAPQQTGSLFTASPSAPLRHAESQDPVSMPLNLTVTLGSTGTNTHVAANGSWDVRQLISHVEKELSTGVTKIVAGMFQCPLLPEDAKLTALGVHDGDVLGALLVEESTYASPSPPYQGSGSFGSSPPHTNAIGSLFGTAPHTTSNLFGAALQAGGTSSGTFTFAESPNALPQTSVGSLFGAAPQPTGSLFTASPSPPFRPAESQDPVSMPLNLTVTLGSTGANSHVAANGSWDLRQLISHVEKELPTGLGVTKIVAGMFQSPLLPEDEKLTVLGVHDGDVLGAVLVEEKIYEVQLLGGTCFEVRLLADGRVENLMEKVRLSGQVGAFFSLIAENAHVLSDETAPLPAGTLINVIQEDPSVLCNAAQQILRNLPAHIEGRGACHQLKSLCLGRCCQLGKFPTSKWKDCPWTDEVIEDQPNLGVYHVLEFTLINGDNKLCSMVGVINEGDADCNTGFWGSVYLRPGFSEVAALTSSGDSESTWKVMDSSWYKDPEPELPRCKDMLSGGKTAASPLETHLSHALAVAYFGKSVT